MGAYRPAYPTEQPPITLPVLEDEYIVKAGDSLWSIAERYLGSGLKWQEIYNFNNLNSTTILIG